jgi:hypothetical protein
MEPQIHYHVLGKYYLKEEPKRPNFFVARDGKVYTAKYEFDRISIEEFLDRVKKFKLDRGCVAFLGLPEKVEIIRNLDTYNLSSNDFFFSINVDNILPYDDKNFVSNLEKLLKTLESITS